MQKKVDKNIRDGISQQCHILSKMLRRIGRENFKKFELYSSRNIFVSPYNDIVPNAKSSDHDQNRSEAETLRSRYAQLMEENRRLNSECSKKEQLLADMTSALFQIRVGAQALDMYDVNPLGDTVESIRERCLQLEDFTRRATGRHQPSACYTTLGLFLTFTCMWLAVLSDDIERVVDGAQGEEKGEESSTASRAAASGEYLL